MIYYTILYYTTRYYTLLYRSKVKYNFRPDLKALSPSLSLSLCAALCASLTTVIDFTTYGNRDLCILPLSDTQPACIGQGATETNSRPCRRRTFTHRARPTPKQETHTNNRIHT